MITSGLRYLFGQHIFSLFGITSDAFRIGAGSLLFISVLFISVSFISLQGKPVVQADHQQHHAAEHPANRRPWRHY